MKAVCLKAGTNYGRLEKKAELDLTCVSLTSYGALDQYEKHYHENAYLSLVVKGAYTEKNKEGTGLLNNGELVFRPAYYDHANGFTGSPGICFNLEFKKDWNSQTGHAFKLPAKNEVYACGVFPVIYKALYAFQTGCEHEVNELFLHWVMEINQKQCTETDWRWIKKVKAILDEETCGTHSLSELAQRVHIHPVHLASCFKQKTGLTIGEYQQRNRLQKGLEMLLNTPMTVTEVALEAGFFDAAHFIRSFVKTYGVAPARFRKRIGKT